jgi:hypothetical protein
VTKCLEVPDCHGVTVGNPGHSFKTNERDEQFIESVKVLECQQQYDSSDDVYRVPIAVYIYICEWRESQGGVDCLRDSQ